MTLRPSRAKSHKRVGDVLPHEEYVLQLIVREIDEPLGNVARSPPNDELVNQEDEEPGTIVLNAEAPPSIPLSAFSDDDNPHGIAGVEVHKGVLRLKKRLPRTPSKILYCLSEGSPIDSEVPRYRLTSVTSCYDANSILLETRVSGLLRYAVNHQRTVSNLLQGMQVIPILVL